MKKPHALRAGFFTIASMGRSEIAIREIFVQKRIRRVAVRSETIGLLVLLVPPEIQPAQSFIYRLQRGLGIPADVGVVDTKNDCSAVPSRVKPIENESARAPDVQKARGRRRETDSEHGSAQYNKPRDFNPF